MSLNNSVVLITGFAGFIGASLAKRLLIEYSNITVVGIDNMNDYYDVKLKGQRVKELTQLSADERYGKIIPLCGIDISDKKALDDIFLNYRPSIVVNLAAQAGVRYSIDNPDAYIKSNIIGFYNILECCRHSYEDSISGVQHLVYASSSSVYGANQKIPYSVNDKTDSPVSLYAATKKSNELMAYTYSKLYNIPATGLRFFTVYGPAGRPDMAYFSFTEKLIKNEIIKIYNYGNCKRDFTYIDDIVEGIVRVIKRPPQLNKTEDGNVIPPYALYNIGNSQPVNLLEFVDILQQELIKANILPKDYDFENHKQLVAMQPGDVPVTYADTSDLENDFGYRPSTPLREGLRRFAEWYRDYYIKG